MFQISGPVSYHVTLVDGRVIRWYVDHVCALLSSIADLNHHDYEMEIFAPTVSDDNTIQPILELVSHSDTAAPTSIVLIGTFHT